MKIPLTELVLTSLGSSTNADMPTHRRIFELIRLAILSHQLQGGGKLPSSRSLAAEIGCSRNTVIAAYEQLLAEGYVKASIGSGTVVADTLPTHQMDTPRGETDLGSMPRGLSDRGVKLTESPSDTHYEIQEFIEGANDFSVFPYKIWQKLQNKYWRKPQAAFMDYARKGGYQPLREVLAEYLRVSRSVRCQPEQILITAGTQQSLDLCANLLADANDMVWMENPGYWGARRVFESNDLSLRPIEVDGDGISPSLADLQTYPRLIYVTPSHQYPLDVVMSLTRRRLLIEFAASVGAWILEDDYDSEFRYKGRPIASLQGLDHHDRVIYCGTFSKVLYPGIRIGYVVVPQDLIAPFGVGLADIHRPGQMAVQAALADFIQLGHFTTHVRNVRARYGQSRALLQHTLQHQLLFSARLSNADAGLHLVIHLPDYCDDVKLAAEARLQHIDIRPLSSYYIASPAARGVVVGYGYMPLNEIVPAAIKLANLVNQHMVTSH
ncbi:MAG: MocR-like pyridoxine biosynthesis transcription factor PdxR [Methylophilaceae bacterium]